MVNLKMRCLRGLILFLFYLCAASKLSAQRTPAVPSAANYIFRNIDNDEGLNSNDVFALTQDRLGYLWIGTNKGLQRYDGLRFLDCPQDANVQGDIAITALFNDTSQRIFYTQNDFQLYQWRFLHHSGELIPLPPTAQTYSDHEGNHWQLRPYRADLYGMQKNGKGPVHADHIIHDGKDTWLIDPEFGVFLADTVHHQFYSPTYNPLRHPLLAGLINPKDIIRAMVQDHHGNLWLYTWGNVFYRYAVDARKMYTYSLADILEDEGNARTLPTWISGILEDNHGTVWVATAKAGLLQYDAVKDGFQYITCVPTSSLSLQYNHQINTLYQDREENIWVGTDKGISLFNPYRKNFTRLRNRDAAPLLNNSAELCTAMQTSSNELWVGSWGGGITMYDSTLLVTRRLFFKGQTDYNQVWSMLEQPDGNIWAGCQHGVLHKINMQTLATETLMPPELEHSTVRVMIHDRKGNTLFGLHKGKIIVWDAATQKFLPFVDNGTPLSAIENLYVDNHNICWASTLKGLQAFDLTTRSFTGIYRPIRGQAAYCKGVTAWNDSTLIVGTESEGLYFFSTRQHVFRKIEVNEEQHSPAAFAVLKDSSGNIWYSGDYNINCYNPQQQRFSTYRPGKGLINDAFRAVNFLITRNGQWLTWTNTELLGFYPDMLRSLQTTPGALIITGFKVYSNPVFIDSLLHEHKPVMLSYQQNFIGIEFSDLQFSGTSQTKYFYRLDGVDKDWVYGGTRGAANYTNLSPGHYLFHVKAGNNSPETQLEIRIAAPFWATTWFRLLCGVTLILTAAGLIRWYNRSVRQEASMKQQLAQTEMMALRAQMNPHFIFNCINSIDALIQTDDKYLATVSLNKFARLIRNILDSSQQHTTTLLHDLETLKLYIDLEQLRNDHPFTAEIKVDANLLDDDCKVPPLIIQPYVENAILHGLRNRRDGLGKLIINILRQGERLVYIIEDNGVGRAAAQNRYHQHQSYGMEMSSSRVELFNGDENIPVIIIDLEENGQPAGTRVEVSLKYC